MRLIYNGKLLVLSSLARAMNRVGYKVHVSHVSRVLRGEREPSSDFVQALCKVLGFTVKEAKVFIDQVAEALREVDNLPLLIDEEGL